MVVQDSPRFRRHHRALRSLVSRLEVIANLLHRHPLNAFLGVDVFNYSGDYQEPLVCRIYFDKYVRMFQHLPLQHEQAVGVSTHVWVNGDREDEILFLTVKIIKLVDPQLLDVFWVHPAMRVRAAIL